MEETIEITNMQRSQLRLTGRISNGVPESLVIVPAGETADVPISVWRRYADRADIKAMHGKQLFIGGKPPAGTVSAGHERDMLVAEREKLERSRIEIEAALEEATVKAETATAKATAQNKQLQAARDAMAEERANIEEARAELNRAKREAAEGG